jgi:hypothetical protein
MVTPSEIIASLTDKFRDQIGDVSQFKDKKWISYGAMLALSLILLLTLGGSKGRRSEIVPSGNENVLAGEVFEEMSDRLVRLGEPDQLSIDWEKIPEGIDPIYENWGHDPFAVRNRKLESRAGWAAMKYQLSAISWKDGEPIVLINDCILSRGEEIEGAEILRIYRDSVILQKGEERIVISLSGGS